ncbi:hypothetical protein JCM11641_001863 [Rhodosporidiobolus odoratus]
MRPGAATTVANSATQLPVTALVRHLSQPKHLVDSITIGVLWSSYSIRRWRLSSLFTFLEPESVGARFIDYTFLPGIIQVLTFLFSPSSVPLLLRALSVLYGNAILLTFLDMSCPLLLIAVVAKAERAIFASKKTQEKRDVGQQTPLHAGDQGRST